MWSCAWHPLQTAYNVHSRPLLLKIEVLHAHACRACVLVPQVPVQQCSNPVRLTIWHMPTHPHPTLQTSRTAAVSHAAGASVTDLAAAQHTAANTLPAAAAASSAPLDLQETFKALATAPPSGALRFAAVFTDGGCDGMKEQDKTYWADHAFQPNPWSPHCRSVGVWAHVLGFCIERRSSRVQRGALLPPGSFSASQY
jgi:hypothetical protein